MTRIDRYETTCRCGHEVVTVAPATESYETRWVRGGCGHITPVEQVGVADLAALTGGADA